MRLSPSSSHLPSPTARTLPRCGFSFAVSGRTMPLAVVSSSSIACTIRRSPKGLSFIDSTSVDHSFLALTGLECQAGTLARGVPGCARAAAVPRESPGSVLRRRVGAQALAQLRRAVRDLGEAHHGHDVVLLHLAAVDLLEEVDHLVEAAELGVVVLDVARRELLDALDVDGVDHRVEDPLAWRVLEAHGDHHRFAFAVLLALVAEPDRGCLAASLQLVDEHRRIEVEHVHARGSLCEPLRSLCGHLPLSAIAQQRQGLLQRHPLDTVHLVVVVRDPSGQIAAEIEGDHLQNALPVDGVPVAHVADLLERVRLEAGLLTHLAHGGLPHRLLAVRMALGERHDGPAPQLHDGQERPAAEAAHHAPARGELALHASSGTSGTKRTGATTSSPPAWKRIRTSRPPRSTGQTSVPSGRSCSKRAAGGSSGAVAVTEIPPNGARSGAPAEPSPTRTSTLSYPSSSITARASSASVAKRSIVTTSR